jgi:hypothetical protein
MTGVCLQASAAPHRVLLCCPACGRQRALHRSEDLPLGLMRMLVTCPACEGHGEDASQLIFNDGRMLDEKSGGKLCR